MKELIIQYRRYIFMKCHMSRLIPSHIFKYIKCTSGFNLFSSMNTNSSEYQVTCEDIK